MLSINIVNIITACNILFISRLNRQTTSALKLTFAPTPPIRVGCLLAINCTLDTPPDYSTGQSEYNLELMVANPVSKDWSNVCSLNLTTGIISVNKNSVVCESDYDPASRLVSTLIVLFNSTTRGDFMGYQCKLDLDQDEKTLQVFNGTCNNSCSNSVSCTEHCNGVTCSCDVNWESSTCNKPCRVVLTTSSDNSTLFEGLPFNITCSSSDQKGDFYWSRSDHCFNDSCKISTTSNYFLDETSTSDSGIYYCFNVNLYCTSRLNYSLNVLQITTSPAQTSPRQTSRNTKVTDPQTTDDDLDDSTTQSMGQLIPKSPWDSLVPYWKIACAIFGSMVVAVFVIVLIIILVIKFNDGDDPEVSPEPDEEAEEPEDDEEVVTKKKSKKLMKEASVDDHKQANKSEIKEKPKGVENKKSGGMDDRTNPKTSYNKDDQLVNGSTKNTNSTVSDAVMARTLLNNQDRHTDNMYQTSNYIGQQQQQTGQEFIPMVNLSNQQQQSYYTNDNNQNLTTVNTQIMIPPNHVNNFNENLASNHQHTLPIMRQNSTNNNMYQPVMQVSNQMNMNQMPINNNQFNNDQFNMHHNGINNQLQPMAPLQMRSYPDLVSDMNKPN